MTLRALIIHPDDNVANLIGPGNKGDVAQCTVEGQDEKIEITLVDDVPSNHKIARVDFPSGAAVIKYGLNIGQASRDVRRGEYVHVHNVQSNRCRGDLE